MSLLRSRLRSAALLAACLFYPLLSWGQADLLRGRVVDAQGRPVQDARVDLNGVIGRSGPDGAFRLESPKRERYILAITHPDYADAVYVARTPPTGQAWALVRAQIETINPKRGGRLTDRRRELRTAGIGGAIFELPPNSLVDEHGKLPAGPVRAAIATLNVSGGEGPGDWAVRSSAGVDGYLISFGAVFVQFTDPSGQTRYQLAPGRAAGLVLPVLPTMRRAASKAPNVPLWYFDTADALWKSAGSSQLDSSRTAYAGKVTHLSTINTDIAKFSDAACLKVTLDASIPVGNKLRIRYHSGGTAFGQAPMFVLSDPVNAAYRLPANTNVLLELLDPSDHAFGNLVVEDPAGTALPNTVVNTGAALPPGASLWPAPPFASCKPIVLRLATPQVEIRINEQVGAVLSRDNPSDDYLTWAPTYALARLAAPMPSPVAVVLRNVTLPPSEGPRGAVVFAAAATPWPVNTTATDATVALSLPGDGSWVPFMVAGKFGFPSTNDKDTVIEAVVGGTVVGTKAVMVRVRKNANNLHRSERSRFLFALRKFRNQVGTNYVLFQEMHRLSSTVNDQAHGQPAFLTWHRAMLLHVERELQKIDPSVALHYWNWDAAAPNVFHLDFIGEADASAGPFGVAEPKFSATNPLNGWNTDLPFSGGRLQRNGSDQKVAPAPGFFRPLDHPVDPDLIGAVNYGTMSPPNNGIPTSTFGYLVERQSHDGAHGWPCGGGHLISPGRSAADPLFYLLHSQIDRQWAYWQWKNVRHGVVGVGGTLTFPTPGHYDVAGTWNVPGVTTWRRGSFLEDGMWPWDGTSGGPVGRGQRPVNQAPSGSVGANIPNSRPAVPMSAFPASTRANLWPVADVVPTSAHMIDYLGRFRPVDGLGFSYDDVPY